MRILFFALLLLPLSTMAQDKPYISIAFGKDFPLHYHVIGGYFTGNGPLGKGFYLGGGSAFLKFDHIEKFYFPLFANLSFKKEKPGRKVFPIAFIQPGYGFYKRMEAGIETTGGFTFHSSAGIAYPFLFKKKGFATIGLAHYTFKTGNNFHNKTSWGGRIGMIF